MSLIIDMFLCYSCCLASAMYTCFTHLHVIVFCTTRTPTHGTSQFITLVRSLCDLHEP